MERKHKLRISKPLDSFLAEENIFQTPRKRETNESSADSNSITELEALTFSTEIKEEKEDFTFLSAFYKIIIFLLVTLLLISFFLPSKRGEKIVEIFKEIPKIPEDYEKIKEELFNLRSKPENLSSLEKGCKINYENTSSSYKYGFFSLRSTDPHSVLTENLKCFAFKGSGGKITFEFPKKVKLSQIGIFHPKTKDTSSSVRDFRLNEAFFSFENNTLAYFDCNLEGSEFTFEVLSNHGKKAYTSVYRIFLIGNEL